MKKLGMNLGEKETGIVGRKSGSNLLHICGANGFLFYESPNSEGDGEALE